ncbi:MAG: RNA polymerase subunit sigma-70 [Eubacterium sp.]|nr:RNA polymerase subunit sigma-70 [Eubacterium sp.]MCH4007536.1 RNA polymerase subunit sigma-70 [Eubacterium sp.]MCH4007771.1 RNA polymerase subunit sigma-70 [Eubacterium sp.]MCH4078562.1 RNA polymerase subunit sigma-70 [Eubacterium sp.]MCH4078797.1 RNA polymerase subunit sigma-70 [Eubacterium sp.]
MNDIQKTQITSLRHEGYGYGRIAQALGLSKSSVTSWCRRNHLTNADLNDNEETPGPAPSFCPVCGQRITQAKGKRKKKFCSDVCRRKWWNSHPERINRKAFYAFTCAACGKHFTAYGNRHRKYCCHACYIADRFKGGIRHE